MTFLCLYISRWWRQTWDTAPYFTVVNQSEARISTEHGIDDITLPWFENYLSNRKQYVTYNGIVSKTGKVNCGVPQGSILGPLLFLLYINDLSTVSEACMSILFADDTNISFTGKNLQTMITVINEELVKVQEWLYCNKLSLNVLKTHYMIFTSRNKCMNDVPINNVKKERVYATKFSGCTNWCSAKLEKAYWIYMQKIVQMRWKSRQSSEKVA